MDFSSNYRTWAMEEMLKGIATVGYVINGVSTETATTKRDGGDGWTVLEVMCHLRDFETVFFERNKLIVEQDTPALPFFDPDDLVTENNYAAASLTAAYAEWKTHRENHLIYLKHNINDADWQRVGQHPRRGPITLEFLLLLTAWHDTNHLHQMVNILQS